MYDICPTSWDPVINGFPKLSPCIILSFVLSSFERIIYGSEHIKALGKHYVLFYFIQNEVKLLCILNKNVI
jgi:hypothetical protein